MSQRLRISTMIDERLLGCFYYINRSSRANPSRDFDQFLTNFLKSPKLAKEGQNLIGKIM